MWTESFFSYTVASRSVKTEIKLTPMLWFIEQQLLKISMCVNIAILSQYVIKTEIKLTVHIKHFTAAKYGNFWFWIHCTKIEINIMYVPDCQNGMRSYKTETKQSNYLKHYRKLKQILKRSFALTVTN